MQPAGIMLGIAALTTNLPSANLRGLRRLAVNNVNPNVTKLASRRGGYSRRRWHCGIVLGFAALTANLPSANLRDPRDLRDLRRLAVNNVNPNVTKLASRRGGCLRWRFSLLGFAALTANLPSTSEQREPQHHQFGIAARRIFPVALRWGSLRLMKNCPKTWSRA